VFSDVPVRPRKVLRPPALALLQHADAIALLAETQRADRTAEAGADHHLIELEAALLRHRASPDCIQPVVCDSAAPSGLRIRIYFQTSHSRHTFAVFSTCVATTIPALYAMGREDQRVASATRSEQLIEMIRLDIVQNTLLPGDRVTEEGLAERYGVSRTPVREALR